MHCNPIVMSLFLTCDVLRCDPTRVACQDVVMTRKKTRVFDRKQFKNNQNNFHK